VYGVFLRKGVRIHEMFNCMLHAKTITIDGIYGTVGSFNLDRWSDQRNLEVNVAIIDRSVAAELEEQFSRNLNDTKEVTLETWGQRRWWTRVIDWACYQVLRL
jgi:cardiolipin synthase